ncbi:MAG: hypothetical protein U1C12_01660 [Patescibacteria group bacterium]|nr:hypothetical protein [Patescibacteria group bacterium]
MKPKLIQDFIYPDLNEQNRQYGASVLQAPVLNPTSDWRNIIPPFEEQLRNGVDSIACYIEAQQHAIASVHEKKFEEHDNNWSARFNALSSGTPSGGDPVKGADSIRNDGQVEEYLMSYDGITSWQEFHSWKGVDEARVRSAGKADLYLYDRHFGVVIQREMPLETKYLILREALKRSPVPMSLYGQTDFKGSYIQKPKGVYDTHMVVALYVSPDNQITVFDTYLPYIKVLPANYNPDYGMVWVVEKRPRMTATQRKSLLQAILELLGLWKADPVVIENVRKSVLNDFPSRTTLPPPPPSRTDLLKK